MTDTNELREHVERRARALDKKMYGMYADWDNYSQSIKDYLLGLAHATMESDHADGLALVPREATEAMVDAVTIRSDEIDEEMRNYVSGISTDWDTGMVAQEHYKAAIKEGDILTKGDRK